VTDYVSAEVDIEIKKGSVTIVADRETSVPESEEVLPDITPITVSPTVHHETMSTAIPETRISTVSTPFPTLPPVPTSSGGLGPGIVLASLVMLVLFFYRRS
jgi:hypothetical protein